MTESNLTLFHGNPYRRERALTLRHQQLAERDPAIERLPLFADEIDWPAWGIELRSSALFTPSRHFVVRASGKSVPPKPVLEALSGEHAPNTFVTLLFPALRSSSPLLKGFAKLGRTTALPTPRGGELLNEVGGILRDAGCPAQPALVRELVERSGDDLLHHKHEAEKLATYLSSEEEIASQRVPGALLYTAGEREVWTLLDSIGERDIVAACAELARLHDDPGRMMTMAIRHLARLTMVRTLLDERVRRSELAKVSGIQGWLLRRLVRQADAWRAEEILDVLRRSLTLDVSVKDGKRRPHDALLELILATSPRSA